MATATKSSNGSAASSTAVRAKEAGSAVTAAARTARSPLLAAGGAAVGLAGGLVLGSQLSGKRRALGGSLRRRRTVLGVALGRKSGLRYTVETLAKATREIGTVTHKVSSATDEIREVRDQLDRVNRQSPVEVLLDGLTHRRGAHKHES